MIMKAHASADLHSHLRSGYVFGPWINPGYRALAKADGVHARPQIHAPNRLGTEFADVKLQLGCTQIAPPFCEEVLQVHAIAGHIIFFEHVVLALMPHEAFDTVFDPAFVEIGQRGLDEIQRQRIHLEAYGLVRIPITAKVRAAGRTLDDGDRRFDVLRDLPCKTQLGAHHIVHMLQRHPSIGTHLVLAPDGVGEQHFALRRLQSGKWREAFDVLHLRVRPHHVRLAGEDEHPQCFIVIVLLSLQRESKGP